MRLRLRLPLPLPLRLRRAGTGAGPGVRGAVLPRPARRGLLAPSGVKYGHKDPLANATLLDPKKGRGWELWHVQYAALCS
jgi:hypothetical protein